MKLKGQRRGESGGNYVDMETGESLWVSGVKKERKTVKIATGLDLAKFSLRLQRFQST